MINSADPDQLASEEANWSGSTLFAKSGYIGVQQNKGFNSLITQLTVRKQTFRHVQLTKTQFSLHIMAVWPEYSLSVWRNCIHEYPKCIQWRFWSDCDAHVSEGMFSDFAVRMMNLKSIFIRKKFQFRVYLVVSLSQKMQCLSKKLPSLWNWE